MAPPRAVARDLRRSATRIAKLADPIVADAAEYAVEQSGVGGSFRRNPLRVVVRSSSNRRGRSSVTVAGKPAGAWSIKSHGRRGGYEVRPRRGRVLDLRRAGLSTTAATITRPASTRGDDRWQRLVADPTRTRFVEVARRHLSDAIEGG